MERLDAIVARVLVALRLRDAEPAAQTTPAGSSNDSVSASVVRTLSPLPRGWKGQVAQHRPLTAVDDRRSLPLVDDEDDKGAA